jgi:predicted outer membrane repeat protein
VQRSLAGGTPAFRVFNVTSGTVNILFLKIANGNALTSGGGINSFEALNVAGCIFSGNHAGPAGGALSLIGVATITGCTFFNNTSDNGGAIFNRATLTDFENYVDRRAAP